MVLENCFQLYARLPFSHAASPLLFRGRRNTCFQPGSGLCGPREQSAIVDSIAPCFAAVRASKTPSKHELQFWAEATGKREQKSNKPEVLKLGFKPRCLLLHA